MVNRRLIAARLHILFKKIMQKFFYLLFLTEEDSLSDSSTRLSFSHSLALSALGCSSGKILRVFGGNVMSLEFGRDKKCVLSVG